MTIELGGNIILTGFKELDRSSMVIVKKLVGSYSRKISTASKNFEQLSIVLKRIHGTEEAMKPEDKFEINVKAIDNGKIFSSEITDFNLFITLDNALAKTTALVEEHHKKQQERL